MSSSVRQLCRALACWPDTSQVSQMECISATSLKVGLLGVYVVGSSSLIALLSLHQMWGRLSKPIIGAPWRKLGPFYAPLPNYGGTSSEPSVSEPAGNAHGSASKKFIAAPHAHNANLVLWTKVQLAVVLIRSLVFTFHAPKTVASRWEPWLTLGVWMYAALLAAINGELSYLVHLRGFYLLSFLVDAFKLRAFILVEVPTVPYPIEFGFNACVCLVDLALVLYSFLMTTQLGELNRLASRTGSYPCPERFESVLSVATFSWVNPLLRYGYSHTIEPPDIWDLRPEEQTAALCSGFSRFPSKWGFGRKVFTYFRGDLLRQLLFSLITLAFGLATPILLHEFLTLVENPEVGVPLGWSGAEYGVYVILALFGAATVKSCSDSQSLFYGRRVGIRAKAIILGEVYAKTLRRKDQTSLKGDPTSSNAGKITNFLSVDAHEVAETCCYWNYLYTVPLQLAVTTWYLHVILGWSALVGLGLTVLIMPLNYWMALRWERVQAELMACSDRRMDIVNELLQGIRIIKFFAWETQFRDRIFEARFAELKVLTRRMLIWVVSTALWFCFPMLITLGTFYTYTKLAGNPLTPTVAFTSLLIFKALREPVDQLPELLNMFLQAKVSLSRIDAFLKEAEAEKFATVRAPVSADEPVLGFVHATLQWDPLEGRSQFSLRDLTIAFPPNELSLVVGPTGAGKTSLLLGLLGEMHLVSGAVFLPRKDKFDTGCSHNGGVAYVAQNAWLQQDTIRNNILFGEPYDARRYRSTLRACALLPDFEALQDGDLTEVGERGLTLSGGQKQRVAIARAVYSRASHILFDDCLSAVDTHTARFLFDGCIMGDLLRGRTRILVTHSVGLAFHHAAHIVVLDHRGIVVANGSRKDVESLPALQAELACFDRLASAERSRFDTVDDAPLREVHVASKLIPEEERARGAVGFSTYSSYFDAAGGGRYWLGLLGLFALYQGIPVLLDWWVKIWASAGSPITPRLRGRSVGHASLASGGDLDYYIGVYALISVGSLLSVVLRVSYQFWGSVRASKRLHADLLDRVLRAPMRFFDTTPIGRLVNRFSKDLQCVDQELMPSAGVLLSETLASLAILGMLVGVLPQFMVAAVGIVLAYRWVIQFYIRGSREMKRIESTTRSPIYAHCGETIQGVTTIRAFECEARFLAATYAKVDRNLRCYFYLWVANRWLQIRSDLTGNLVALATGVLLLAFRSRLSPALAGLALSYALNFSSHILWIARYYSVVEMNLNSIERLQEYLSVAPEPPLVVEACRPPPHWPTRGQISIRNLVIRYAADRDPVIRGISFDVRPGEKVGIVGRTGAGKSTLALAFFRFIDAEVGSIAIDGLDIYRLGLNDLRSRLTIIPQDAVLFSGTIRSNLDPFEQHPDQRLWHALRRVHFGAPTAFTLDQPVTENGRNFSQGQRQLLALARALLRRSRVIIMDEATASVDHATDASIQATIRQEFSHCTLLCIAHRLRTIIDYDRVLVMDRGCVKEFDTPAALLSKPNGHFRSMCRESGDLESLLQLAGRPFS
ncbi:Transporter of the ATP-binding cassette (ABC) [Massospora cicadina]|nr:Transporter of the ATP-binding cassette (ABC) [Massospora cicadina]